MIVQKQEGKPAILPSKEKKSIPWFRLLLALGLSLLGLWYVTRDVALADLRLALASARPVYILPGLLIILATTVVKTWRWQQLFQPPSSAPSLQHLFWSLMVGQIVNTAVPFLRLGDLARVYDLGQRSGQSKAQTLGTLVVEKTLELVTLAFILLLLLPVFVLPDLVSDSGLGVGLMALTGLAALYAVAWQTARVRRMIAWGVSLLPDAWQPRLLSLLDATLSGLAALRSGRASLALLGSSLLIGLLYALTPYVLFPALGLPLGLKHAAAIHVALTAGALPASTPANVGIFEGLVTFMLASFGIGSDAVRLAYALIFHLVVIIPQFLLGGLALLRQPDHA